MRPIDADALKKAFCNHCDGEEPCTEPCIDIGLIETAKTIDAVPVVRCGECKYWEEESTFCLNKEGCYGSETTADWFCADGEQ